MRIEEIMAYADINLAKTYLKDMIRINSVTGNEGELADYIIDKFRGFGIKDIRKQFVEEGRYNVIAHFQGEKPGPTILLTGHLDTVNPGDGWYTSPFEPIEKDGKIYGRGSNDMKAGIAIILATIKVASEHRSHLPGSIVIAFVPDEEAYSSGIIKLVKEGIKADFGISAEPHYNSIIIGAPGKILINVDITGLAAHGATPHLGINAIEDAAKFIAGLETLSLKEHEKIQKQPYVTLRIDGGFKEYGIVVPDRCSILINKHTVPGETKEEVIGALKELVKDLNLRSKFIFTIEKPFYPSYALDEDNFYIKKLCINYESITGKKANLAYANGVSDNNYLVPEGGIPTVCLGPSGGNMHSCNEWVSLEEMRKVLKIYLKFLFKQD